MNQKLMTAVLLSSLVLISKADRVRAAGDAISLDAAIQRSLENNPEIGELTAALNQSRSAVEETKSLRLPKLSAVGQYTTSDDASTQLSDSNQAVARGEQSLFQGGRIAADINRLKNIRESASADLDVKKIEIVSTIQGAYFRIITEQEQIDLWTQAQAEYGKLLKLIEPKFSVGSVPEFDYAKIRLSIAQYEQEKLSSQRALSHDLYSLGAAMGSEPPVAVLPLPDVPPPPDLSLEALLTHLPSRPDVRSAEKQLSAQTFSVTRAYRDRWPDLKVVGDYGYSGMTASDATLGWGFSALANLPLYDFGTIHQRISQAEAGRSAQGYRVEALRLKIRTEMNDALQQVKTAWENLQIIKDNLPQAQKAYESSLRRYRTGLAPMTELSDAHDLWVQSRIQFTRATSDYRIALSQLSAVQGLLVNQK